MSNRRPSMEDQLKRDFSVTKKLSPINNHSSPAIPPFGANEDEFFGSFPPGYRFRPLDEELVVDYLVEKIYGRPLPRNRIQEVQLYMFNPDKLAANCKTYGEDEWYFFTPRDRKYPNGNRPKRSAGDGYWKATGKDKPIIFDGKKVGSKTSLVFYRGKPPRGDKTDWIMHEYKLLNAPKREKVSKDDMKLDEWVLCKLKRKKKPEKTAKSDKIEKPDPIYVQPENVSSTPAMDNGISESMLPPYNASFAYGPDNFVPWMDCTDQLTLSSKFPCHNTLNIPYDDHHIYEGLESIGFETTEFDEFDTHEF